MSRSRKTISLDSAALRELLWLVAGWLAVVGLARYSSLDHALSALFYDPIAQAFPRRHDPFWADVLYRGLKAVSIVGWLLLAVIWARLRWRRAHEPLRAAIGFTLLIGPLAAVVVSWARANSVHSCPWDLALYGGAAEYFRLFDSPPANAGPGRCAPSGHASAGFLWLAGYIAARRAYAPQARYVLIAALGLGAVAGTTQIVRGAHFLSHVLLTAWICLAVAWLCERLRSIWRARRASAVDA